MKRVNEHPSVSLKKPNLYFRMESIKQRFTRFLEDAFEANR
jgi:hypothetical protein